MQGVDGRLFKEVDEQAIADASRLGGISRRRYAAGEVIAWEGDPCDAIGIVLSGAAHVQRFYPSGKAITISTLGPGESFGEAVVFSHAGHYPATIVAAEDTEVAFLGKRTVLQLCARSEAFLVNLLGVLSDRVLMLNQRVKMLASPSVRQRVAQFLVEEARRQGATDLCFPYTRTQMAEYLGLPQPSLSRELAAMRERGWITFDRRRICILDLEALEDCLEA
ncbi:MAG: Crp/Fnr family transcriptional regulator [Anaerolineae bacterium]